MLINVNCQLSIFIRSLFFHIYLEQNGVLFVFFVLFILLIMPMIACQWHIVNYQMFSFGALYSREISHL